MHPEPGPKIIIYIRFVIWQKDNLPSWRVFLVCFFFCCSMSKRYSRAKAEPSSKQKTMWWGTRGEKHWEKHSLPFPLAPSPPPHLTSFSVYTLGLSCGCVPYFTNHKRNNILKNNCQLPQARRKIVKISSSKNSVFRQPWAPLYNKTLELPTRASD